MLKQTMDMYSTACKEAVREKKKVYDADPYLSIYLINFWYHLQSSCFGKSNHEHKLALIHVINFHKTME